MDWVGSPDYRGIHDAVQEVERCRIEGDQFRNERKPKSIWEADKKSERMFGLKEELKKFDAENGSETNSEEKNYCKLEWYKNP